MPAATPHRRSRSGWRKKASRRRSIKWSVGARARPSTRSSLTRVAAAQGADARLAEREALLDEVTALVEWPAVYVAQFEPEFLTVPPECLILTMQANQKYFPLFDSAGKLTNRFLIVSNMQL